MIDGHIQIPKRLHDAMETQIHDLRGVIWKIGATIDLRKRDGEAVTEEDIANFSRWIKEAQRADYR
jgi:hypothetical protein